MNKEDSIHSNTERSASSERSTEQFGVWQPIESACCSLCGMKSRKAEFRSATCFGRTYIMCHMIADNEDELHAMAAKIGVARKWYQDDHYDIAQSTREKAIAVGARPITKRQLSAMAMLRRWGAPMGSPEDAMERLLAFNKSRATLSASDTRDEATP